jgi:hypothetical protein
MLVACRDMSFTRPEDTRAVMPTNTEMVMNEEQRTQLSSIAQLRSLLAGYVLAPG